MSRQGLTFAGWLLVVAALSSAQPVHAQVVTREVLQSVWVHDVPNPPEGDFWDPILRNLFTAAAGEIYPDVVVCVTTTRNGHACTDVCTNAQLDTTRGGPGKSEDCLRPFGEGGLALPADNPAIRVSVIEVGPGQRQIGVVDLADPARCPDSRPCRASYPNGDLVLSFGTIVEGTAGRLSTPGPVSPAPQIAPVPVAPGLSWWDRATRTWDDASGVWDRFWDLWTPSDIVDGVCTVQRNTIVGWVCDTFLAGPVRTMSNAREGRIACLKGALGGGERRSLADNACAAFPTGSGELESCLLRFFDDVPPACMQGATMQNAK